MNQLEFPFTQNLTPHPLNLRIYGHEKPSAELVASISALGVLEPLLIDRNRQILSGHRRWMAARQVGLDQVPVIYFKASDLEAERMIIEANRQRVKTAAQKGREFKELKRIETELAKQHQLAALKQGAKKPVKENFPERETGQARDKAAETIGISGRTAEKLEKLVDAADAGDSKAAAALADIDRKKGRGVDTAYRAVVQPSPKPPKNPELVAAIQAHEQAAIELTNLLNKNGIDADVSRSKTDGQFHVTWHDATAEQIREFAEVFKL